MASYRLPLGCSDGGGRAGWAAPCVLVSVLAASPAAAIAAVSCGPLVSWSSSARTWPSPAWPSFPLLIRGHFAVPSSCAVCASPGRPSLATTTPELLRPMVVVGLDLGMHDGTFVVVVLLHRRSSSGGTCTPASSPSSGRTGCAGSAGFPSPPPPYSLPQPARPSSGCGAGTGWGVGRGARGIARTAIRVMCAVRPWCASRSASAPCARTSCAAPTPAASWRPATRSACSAAPSCTPHRGAELVVV